MNTKHIHDLTLRLCQALDQNYDVVNMDAVMSVISTLEGTKITKEQLETTRLAKFINHLRRRTKDEHLARRAKSLLKKWREMVGIQQQQQPVIDPVPTTSTTALPSVSGHNTSLYQQRLRSQSVSPAASSLHFDAIQHQSNSNSSQVVAISSTPSAIADHLPRVTNAISGSLPSLSTASCNAYISNKKLANIENQNERTSGASIHIIKQPTSFENVLVGFGVTDRSNLDISSENATYRNKLNKPVQQHVTSSEAETFIIDQSSNSNSEKSLMLPLNSRPTNLAPIIIDIQDSNSGSNLIAPISSNKPITNKTPITGTIRAQSISLDSKLNIANSPLKQKKVKKDKRRKEKNDYDIHEEIHAVGDSKVATVLLDETSSNQQHQRQPDENDEKYSSFVNEEKSSLAYPEILSLLDNSSMSSMFPQENSANPTDEQNKAAFSASNSSRTSFNLSTSDLTFTGKFKPSSTLLPTTSSSDAVLYNTHRRTISPKNTPTNIFSLNSGPTTSKFIPFRDVGYNSNDSNSNSQASQADLIDVVSSDKMMQAQRKQDNLILQSRTTPALTMLTTLTLSTSNGPPPKLQPTKNREVTSNALVSPEKKIPRKRGRKKGSKGVDSIIAKETSLSSQMLISTLGMGSKKVKTTKELYAEMQNRKLGIPACSPSPSSTGWQVTHQQQQSSRPTSSCSEPSLQSPHTFDACSTNATMSTIATRSTPENFSINAHAGECETTSDTGTSEPSRDSSAIPKHLKRSLSIDSNSNIQQPAEIKVNTNPVDENKNSDTSNRIAAIEKELIEVLSKLPPVPLPDEIQLKCTAELVPCTCKIIEISLSRKNESAENEINEKDAAQANVQKLDCRERILSEQVDTCTIKSKANGGNTINSDKCIVKQLSVNSPLPLAVLKPKPKKSIFDLDFDEDEDPLPKIIAEAAAASLKKEHDINTKVKEEPEVVDTTLNAFQHSQLIDYKVPVEQPTQLFEEIPVPILPTYEVDEDPQCEAKQRFNLQTQKITKFHIDALHNCFIPNVNGNWDDANYTIAQNMPLNEFTNAADIAYGYVITDGSDVVPKYGSLATERIPKDLSHIDFFKNFVPETTTAAEQKCAIPFIGVAHSVLRNKLKSHNHKKCHKAKVISINKYASHSNVSGMEELEPNKRTEEYKTDEQGVYISVMANSQTASENCDLKTDDTEVTESKGLTDICNQLNDSVLSLTNTFNVTAGTIVNKNNNNNVMLKDITIDVAGHGSDLFLTHSSELSENDRNGQNLLAIADHLDYSSNIAKKPLNFSNSVNIRSDIEANNIPTEIKEYSTETEEITADTTFPNTLLTIDTEEENRTSSSNKNDNSHSRHSSSCSNSSLKHQSTFDVNGDRIRKRRKCIRRSLPKNVHGASALQDNKHSKIKRIKIAINGKLATEMQFSGDSNSNNSDDEVQFTDDNDVANKDIPIEDRNKNTHMVAVEMSENASINSPSSQISTCNQYNLSSGDDEHFADSGENNYNDEHEIDYDYYGDPDVGGEVELDEYEDVDDYSGFHEVVTRDISASLTGNNHIVLTIKKTPSKTNSPSNSLSAMSPVIASSNMYGSQQSAATSSPIISKTSSIQTKNMVGDIDMNALIVKKLEVCEDAIAASRTEVVENDKLSSMEEIQPQLISDVQVDTHLMSNMQLDGVINSPKVTFGFGDSQSCVTTPVAENVHVRKRKQVRSRKIKKSTKEPSEFSRDVKRHRELFFEHEVIVTDSSGFKQSILNFSSCSSSCGDDSDYDHCNDFAGTSIDSNEKSSSIADSEIDIKFAAFNMESYDPKMDEVSRQCKRAMSASPCSTYASCSTCNLPSENFMKTEFCSVDNTSGDAPDLKTKLGVEGGDFGEDRIIAKEDCEDNGESTLTANTAFSNTKSIPTLADAIDNNIEDNVNEELPLENNGLLYSFNNIYYPKDKLEAQTNYATINNGILVDMRKGHMLSDIADAGPTAINAAKQQELILPNKNCDDYNNIYNKISNNINLIRYYINDPSLKTHVNFNKQSGRRNEDQQKEKYVNIDDDCNVNTDASVNIDTQLQFADDNGAVINIGCTAHTEQNVDNADKKFNNTGASSSVQTRCTEVLVPHNENRTGLRAVDEDVDDEDGNNCARIQQFKEWHQVLQLRSYNDELLTVLPYVVLD